MLSCAQTLTKHINFSSFASVDRKTRGLHDAALHHCHRPRAWNADWNVMHEACVRIQTAFAFDVKQTLHNGKVLRFGADEAKIASTVSGMRDAYSES